MCLFCISHTWLCVYLPAYTMNISCRLNTYLSLAACIHDYLLEKSRVVHIGSHERNFHVFYYMFAGMPEEILRYYYLEDPKVHRLVTMHYFEDQMFHILVTITLRMRANRHTNIYTDKHAPHALPSVSSPGARGIIAMIFNAPHTDYASHSFCKHIFSSSINHHR